MAEFAQDKASSLEYAFDWRDWLAEGETISTAAVTATSDDLSVDNVTLFDGSQQVACWVSGGEYGQLYDLACSITTNGGREHVRSQVVIITPQ